MMDCKIFLWVVLFSSLISEIFSVNCNKEKRCKTARIHGLKTSDCFKMDWKEFPKCLPSDIEVLELSYNRIRKISNSDLQRYPYLSHLYLTDNLLVNLDNDIFKDISKLETLDLSFNAISKVPPAIFQMPKLKTLYLSQNLNINIAESIQEAGVLARSSLTKLDISYITDEDETTDFPDFGELPYLAFLNVTGNQFNYLSPKHFAGLCNLQILVNINMTAIFENDCDCWKINQWLKQRKIQYTTLLCPISEVECNDQEINPEDLDIYRTCRQKFEDIEKSILLSKVGIGIAAGVGIILLLIAIFVYRRWNRNRQQNKARQLKNDINRPDSLQPLNKLISV